MVDHQDPRPRGQAPPEAWGSLAGCTARGLLPRAASATANPKGGHTHVHARGRTATRRDVIACGNIVISLRVIGRDGVPDVMRAAARAVCSVVHLFCSAHPNSYGPQLSPAGPKCLWNPRSSRAGALAVGFGPASTTRQHDNTTTQQRPGRWWPGRPMATGVASCWDSHAPAKGPRGRPVAGVRPAG